MSYVRVSILGSAVGGEVWSINPVFDPTLEFPGTIDQAALDSAAAAIGSISPGAIMLTALSSALSITGARVEVRDDASDALLALSIYTRPTPLPGTGTPFQAPQAAIVTSLRTNTPGASGRGRLYWPLIGIQTNTSLRISASNVTTFLTAMKAYLLAIRDALATAFPTIGYNVAVRSRATHTTPHVVRIQAGDVVDTQRRRRDSLPESYSSLSIP